MERGEGIARKGGSRTHPHVLISPPEKISKVVAHPALRRGRQEPHELQANLGYVTGPCIKRKGRTKA